MDTRAQRPTPAWSILGTQDPQTVTSDWLPVEPVAIDGVRVKEVRNVPTGTGTLTEMFRTDWGLDDLPVTQVFQRTMEPHSISAWHAHDIATDRLFCGLGRVRIVLFDARTGSPSHGEVWTRIIGVERPQLVIVPPGVWHGVQSVTSAMSMVINIVDHAYGYEQPDHWRLPPDTDKIPYRFPA